MQLTTLDRQSRCSVETAHRGSHRSDRSRHQLRCCAGPALFDHEQLGFALGSDGLLADDGAGGADALYGFDVQGTWTVFEGLLVFQMTSNASESGGVTLETGPHKLDARFGYSGMDSIYATAQ